MPKAVITNWVHDETLDLLRQHCEVVPNESRDALPREEIIRRAHDAEAIMVFMPDRIDAGFLDACPELKIVSAALKGYDNFDVEACTQRNIWFSIVPDLLTIPTAEIAIGHLLSISRNTLKGDRLIREGKFNGWRPILYGKGLSGSTVGIIGYGAVGRAIAQRLAGFDLDIRFTDPEAIDNNMETLPGVKSIKQILLNQLLAESDFVIMATPLSRETTHLLDEANLSKMKKGSYLINIGRGSTVDEEAILHALQCSHLAGYAADVFEFEDWAKPDRPQRINASLLENPDTLFTPHLGSAVREVRLQIETEAVQNILKYLKGEKPPGAINSF